MFHCILPSTMAHFFSFFCPPFPPMLPTQMRTAGQKKHDFGQAYGGSQMPFTYSFEKGLGHSGTRRPASDFEDDLAQASRSPLGIG